MFLINSRLTCILIFQLYFFAPRLLLAQTQFPQSQGKPNNIAKESLKQDQNLPPSPEKIQYQRILDSLRSNVEHLISGEVTIDYHQKSKENEYLATVHQYFDYVSDSFRFDELMVSDLPNPTDDQNQNRNLILIHNNDFCIRFFQNDVGLSITPPISDPFYLSRKSLRDIRTLFLISKRSFLRIKQPNDYKKMFVNLDKLSAIEIQNDGSLTKVKKIYPQFDAFSSEVFDLSKNSTPLKSESFVSNKFKTLILDPKGHFIIEKSSYDWVQFDDVYVPSKYHAESFNQKTGELEESLDIQLQWKSVNKPIDPEIFSYHTIPVSTTVQVYDLRTKDRKPVLIDTLNPVSTDLKAEVQAEIKEIRNKLFLIPVILIPVGVLLFFLVRWYRRRRVSKVAS